MAFFLTTFNVDENSALVWKGVDAVLLDFSGGTIVTERNQFQLSTNAAESYERQKVPAIFAPMAEATLDAITLPLRASVLDIACGTGAVGRAVASRLVEPSKITGADLNPAMVEIASQNIPNDKHEYEFLVAPAATMPFEDSSFDLVFCQHGLQFFPDKPNSLAEMRRVMGMDGKLYLTCWAGIPPMFQVVHEVLGRRIGSDEAECAVAPFVWNDEAIIGSMIEEAGFDCPASTTLAVDRTMPATSTAMRDEILATPNEPALRAAGDDAIDMIVSEILEGVAQYKDGQNLVMPQAAHLFQAVAI